MRRYKHRFNGVERLIYSLVKDELDMSKCNKCGKKGTRMNLTVHHKKKYSKNPQLALEKSNLVVLCKECHAKVHGGKR